MAVEQLALELELDGKADYFEYIVDSVTNGQRTQARELYENLTMSEAIEFFDWVEVSFHYEGGTDREKHLAIEELRSQLNR